MKDPDQQVRDVAIDSIKRAVSEGRDREGAAKLIRDQIKQQLGRDSFLEGLSINEEDHEFDALVAVQGRRGVINVSGEL